VCGKQRERCTKRPLGEEKDIHDDSLILHEGFGSGGGREVDILFPKDNLETTLRLTPPRPLALTIRTRPRAVAFAGTGLPPKDRPAPLSSSTAALRRPHTPTGLPFSTTERDIHVTYVTYVTYSTKKRSFVVRCEPAGWDERRA